MSPSYFRVHARQSLTISRTPGEQDDHERLLKEAQEGDAESQFVVGNAYANGTGVQMNKQLGLEWLEKASKQGHAEASYTVGLLRENEDAARAVPYYQIAADKGHVKSNFKLGTFYLRGTGVPLDVEKAVTYFTVAADAGDAESQFHVAWCYHYDSRVKKNLEKAVHYYQLAANQNHGNALNNLGECYHYGDGVTMDREKAAEFFVRAAEQNTGVGNLNVGVYYYFGYSVKMGRYLTKAVTYYRLAAEAGVSAAYHNIGWCYHNGLGTNLQFLFIF